MPGWKGKANHVSFCQNRNNCEAGQHDVLSVGGIAPQNCFGVLPPQERKCVGI